MSDIAPDRAKLYTIGNQSITVNEKIIPWGSKWPKDDLRINAHLGDRYKADRLLSGGSGKVRGITVHNTNDLCYVHDDAKQYVKAVWPNANMHDVRVHYFVDDVSCWQQLNDTEVGWHAGDGRGFGNDSTISVEIIMRGDNSEHDKKAEARGVILVSYLAKKYGLTVDDIYTHNHWMGQPDHIVIGAYKNCPYYILPHWPEFKGAIGKILESSGSVLYRVQVGAFREKDNAIRYSSTLRNVGYSTYITESDGFYRVQVGAFHNRDNAVSMMEKVIKDSGISAFISIDDNFAVNTGAKTVTELANEVIQGLWGNGQIRKERLEASGYSYDDIQKEVNAILKRG